MLELNAIKIYVVYKSVIDNFCKYLNTHTPQAFCPSHRHVLKTHVLCNITPSMQIITESMH